MSPKSTERVLVARAAIMIASALGLAAGYLLGCVAAIPMAEDVLDQSAKLVAVQEDASAEEARSLLNVLKDSPYPTCSDGEIDYFRELVFRSQYLKDAGRIRGGRIDCSATTGRPTRTVLQFMPAIPNQDGTIAYSNLVPIRDATMKRAGLQLGSGYVVFGPLVPASPALIPMHFTVTMKEAGSPHFSARAGAANQGRDAYLTTNGTTRVGDTLYATRCSTLRSDCVTASASVAEAFEGERGNVIGCAVIGLLCGMLVGLGFSIARRRSQTMEQRLRRAIRRDQLQVVYQPIVNLANGRIVGAEALSRWNDEGATVSPDVFVRVAEEHGFVGDITSMVMRRALRSFAETLRSRPGFRLSVNVAAADLADPGFLPMLDETIKRTKVPPRSLAIEITESSTANREVAMETVRMLRRRGHSVHIDDFGTGYSSLSYLLYLSVDTIKIDKAFTQAIGTESVTVAILPQILAMAESLNLEVVVEGVENGRQADYFSTAGRSVYGQGWLYGRPVTEAEFHGLLADNWGKPPVSVDFDGMPLLKAGPVLVERRVTA
jgi:sensor c-di-GMP phosphodiesterase-like protein